MRRITYECVQAIEEALYNKTSFDQPPVLDKDYRSFEGSSNTNLSNGITLASYMGVTNDCGFKLNINLSDIETLIRFFPETLRLETHAVFERTWDSRKF